MLLSTPPAPENRNNIKLKNCSTKLCPQSARGLTTYKYENMRTQNQPLHELLLLLFFDFIFFFHFLAWLFCFLFFVSQGLFWCFLHSLTRSLAHQFLSSALALALAHSVLLLREIVMYLYVAYLCFGISEIAQRNMESTREERKKKICEAKIVFLCSVPGR